MIAGGIVRVVTMILERRELRRNGYASRLALSLGKSVVGGWRTVFRAINSILVVNEEAPFYLVMVLGLWVFTI